MYNWLRRRYMDELEAKFEDMIENGDISPEDAEWAFQEELEDWEAGYGDYMYDLMNDR